jgi:hypothetical protein
LAAALPVVRKRCDHLTTLATLTLNVLAAARQLSPAETAATYNALAKIQRICLGHPCWPPTPASILNQKLRPLGIWRLL